MKIARTVLRRGKFEKIYLFQQKNKKELIFNLCPGPEAQELIEAKKKIINLTMKITHLNTIESLKEYIKVNPSWISGFVDGEGCFTGSLLIDPKATWGLQPQCEFNIVQNNVDKLLLEAIKVFFEDKGGVYSKPNDISVYAVRNLMDLKNVISPFFEQNPLITNKKKEFEIFLTYLNLLLTRNHVGKTLSSRDQLKTLACILKNLNAKRLNSIKIIRINVIIDWLSSLDHVPSIQSKLELQQLANKIEIRKEINLVCAKKG